MKRGLLFALLFAVPAFSQEFRSTLSGVVTDAGGGNVPNAKIEVTEEHTGTKAQTASDSAGHYTVPFLLPGDYDIAVTMQGFKAYLRKGVHIGSDERPVIDISLEVGNTSQSVEVTADVPLVNSENATVGQTITAKEVEDMPLNGRTPMMLAQLSLGVIATAQPSLVHPFDSAGGAAWSIGGSPSQVSELLIDGSPDATWDGRLAYSPPQDAVQEVRVVAFDSDAAYGHSGGGTLNQVLKSGTNSIHGSLWEFNQPDNLTANTYFNDKSGLPSPVTHFNQYGLTAGGPVFIPKVFDGRNKLFWFFAWEGLKDSQPNTTLLTVPTDAEKNGDFSQILATDKTQLYDPTTATQSGSTITRLPYANNLIPMTQLNPIALAYLKFYPEPNITPLKPDGFDNYGANAPTVDDFNNELGRLDYNMSQKSRLFFDIRRTGYDQLKNEYFGNLSTGSLLFRNNWGGNVDEVYTVNATNVVDVRINFTRMYEAHAEPSEGFNPSTLGFPSYLASSSHYLVMPDVAFSSNTGLQSFSDNSANLLPSQSLQLFGDWVSVKGKHTLKFGGDARQYRLNAITFGDASGQFSFSGNSWVRQSSSTSSTVVLGQDLASFMLGLPYSGEFDLNTYGSWYSYYAAGFVQDDWRIARNLTINLGLRYEWNGPWNEKYGRTVNGFDTTTANPLASAAAAAYAKNPISQLPANEFNVLGGLTFPSNGGTAVFQNTSHLVSPRAGFAWTPDMFKGKLVVRGGFGMFVAPVTLAYLGPNGTYSSSPLVNQEGFSQSTTFTVPSSGLVTPVNTLTNPFPSGFLQPAGSAAGLATFEGQNISFINPEMKSPYSLRWNFGIQESITPNLLLEVAYIGNHSLHLPVDVTQLNGIPRQYLSTLPTRDPSVSYLTGSVTNPFSGLTTNQNTATTAVDQLLARYPQFPTGNTGTWNGSGGVIEQNLSVGDSMFDSLNVRIEKRLSHGLLLVGNYVFSRLIEQDTWLNDTDPVPERRISPFDHTQRFVVGFGYEIPFHSSSRLWNNIAGGWSLNGIYTYETGGPLAWDNGSSTTPGDYVYLGGPLDLNARNTNSAAFNTAAFDTKSGDAFQFHIRTFSSTFPNLRADGINQLDPSLLKRINFGERTYLQLRLEAFNVLNHPTFSAPSTTANSSGFGLITAQANRQRTIQLGARFVF